jgi:hypothetical protein
MRMSEKKRMSEKERMKENEQKIKRVRRRE